MNFTRRPFASRSPPQTFSNSSIEIFFVDAITEFFTITLFIFKLLNFLFLSCLPEASCSDWRCKGTATFAWFQKFRRNLPGVVATGHYRCDKGRSKAKRLSWTNKYSQLFCGIKRILLTFGRRYFRSRIKIKAFLFCILLVYSYLCSVNNDLFT